MLWDQKPYYSLNSYFKKTYHEKIYKIALDAGMTCPNRDGTLDHRGCIFCSAGGSGDFAAPSMGDFSSQLQYGISLMNSKKIGARYVAYFQSYTNTYAPVEKLRTIFSTALKQDEIVGISIATRPDCIYRETIDLFLELKKQFPDKFIWLELGLQTIHEETATYIRRGYPLSVFDQALSMCKKAGIPVIVHVILGLPFEGKEKILQTISYLNSCEIFGIKLQLLHVLKNTDLAIDYQANLFEVLSLDTYLDILTACIAHLSPDIVIHRVTGDGPKELLIAPTWSLNKRNVLNSLHKRLKQENIWQGKDFIKEDCS